MDLFQCQEQLWDLMYKTLETENPKKAGGKKK